MRGGLTRILLSMAAFALAIGCEAEPPSKPCPCTKADGCRCPLPAPKSSTSLQPPSHLATVKVANSAHRHSHLARRERHREEREASLHRHRSHREVAAEDRETGEANTEERESRTNKAGRSAGHRRERSGYEGALAYGYHSESRSYSMNEGHRSERSSELQRYREDRESDSGGGSYSDDGRGETHESALPENGAAAAAPMSINAPSAQDSWHGYDFDCPGANAGK
jgi:hypothetical protein